MAEFTFPCPSCHKSVQCDDAWSGQQINCPICQALFTVPKNVPATDNPLVPKPPAESRLATAQSTKVARSSFGSGGPVVREFHKPLKKKSKKGALVYTGVAVGIIAAGVLGYMYGWPAFQKWKEERAAAEAAPAATKPAEGDAAQEGAAPAEPTPAPEPAVTNLPVILPVYTLELAKAEIPKAKLNGMISGTNFVADLVRLDRVGAASVLTMRQGTGQTPDRGIQVALRLPQGETTAEKTINVTPSEKPTTVNYVTKLWKKDPRYAAQQRNFFTGYALKLEFGAQAEDGSIPGKIYLALPDTEKSVVAGNFVIASANPSQPGYEAAPVQQATPQDPEAARRFQQRYGIKR
jgi:hypothetical protein